MVRLLVSKVAARSSARCRPLPCSSSTIAKRRSVRFICSLSFVQSLVGQGVGEVVLGSFDVGEGDGGEFGREAAGLFVEWKQVVMPDFVAAVQLVDDEFAVHVDANGRGMVFRDGFQAEDERLVLGLVVGEAAQVFFAACEQFALYIFDDDSGGRVARVAARSAVCAQD